MIENLKPYPEIKDSGLPWLGEVPVHWQVLRIKAVLQETDRRSQEGTETLLSLTRIRGLIPHRDMTEKMHAAKTLVGYKRYRAGQLVMNRMQAWSGMFGAGRADGLVSPDYAVFDVLGRHSVQFVLERIKSPDLVGQFALESKGIGSGFNRLYTDRFGQIAISLPPPSEQAAIARFLSWATNRLDRAIGAKRRIIALLQEQKQAIIHRAVTRGLDPSVPLKDSGIPWLGGIPEHWEVRKLKKISPRVGVGLVINPSSYYVDHQVSGAVPMLLGNNIAPMGFKLDRLRYISHAANEELPASRLFAGDIVVVRVGAPGVAAVVPPHLDGCNCASVMIIRGHSSYSGDWLALSFNSSVASRQIDIVKYGAAQKQFNIGHAVDFLFPVPPLKEQQLIVDYVATETLPISKAISRVESEITLLREYRTRLIADVVTGKLDVREVAAGLPEEIEPSILSDGAGYDGDDAGDDPDSDPIDTEED